MLTEQIAGIYVASLGDVPRWFADGAARWAASRSETDDSRVSEWRKAAPEVARSLSQPDDFQTGKLSPAQASIAAFSFVELLTTDRTRFHKLLNAVRDGDAFDDAFRSAYGGTAADVAQIWVQRARRAR
jgi:hypothetical protein